MKYTEQQLYHWASNQRTAYSKGKLDARRIALLEKIPGWVWNTYDSAFENGVAQFKKYGNVSLRTITPDGFALGKWILSTRSQTKDPERRKLLEAIPGWTWDKRADNWTQSFNLSKKYGVVAQQFVTPDGIKLGQWQYHQRITCKDKDKRILLESLSGWSWDPHDEAWEIGFTYTKKYGVVAKSFITKDGYRLGLWQNRQMQTARKNPERSNRLETIKGWVWSKQEKQWNEGYAHSKKCGVVTRDFVTKDGYKLGQWQARQRQICNDTKRRKLLEKIPGWSWNSVKARHK